MPDATRPTRPPTKRDLLDRLADKFTVGDGCWEWTATRTGTGVGYGSIHFDGHGRPAHRLLYELLVGPIPDGLQLDHLCRNTGCVRPAHLEPVTQRVNIIRGTSVVARYAAQTHCKRGHPFDDANTYLYRGRRGCRKCMNERTKRWQRQQKEKQRQ